MGGSQVTAFVHLHLAAGAWTLSLPTSHPASAGRGRTSAFHLWASLLLLDPWFGLELERGVGLGTGSGNCPRAGVGGRVVGEALGMAAHLAGVGDMQPASQVKDGASSCWVVAGFRSNNKGL